MVVSRKIRNFMHNEYVFSLLPTTYKLLTCIMSTRIKFFRNELELRETFRFLNSHGIKTYIRNRTPSTVAPGEEAFGFDLFVLRDADVEEARQLLDYEFGSQYGETTE